jgi:hypothetical protein
VDFISNEHALIMLGTPILNRGRVIQPWHGVFVMARQQIAARKFDLEPAQASGPLAAPAESHAPAYDARDLHAFLEAQINEHAAPSRRLPPIAGLLLAFGAGAALWAFVAGVAMGALR